MPIERSLLYVSRKRIPAALDEWTVAQIVEVARARNVTLNVTGALVATTDHFAQILEGPAAAIIELMDSIHRDPRHNEVTTLRVNAISQRSFPTWSMAYSGASTYVSRQIAPLVGSDFREGLKIERLITLMTGLAT